MLRKKQAGLPLPKERPAPAPTNVVNLMDALRRSIANSRGAVSTSAAAPPKKSKKRVEGQREMLLPISGKTKDEPKKAAKPALRRKAG